MVNILWSEGDNLRQQVGTNPQCRRLGKWPEDLIILVNNPGFSSLSWDEAQIYLQNLNLSKYCDFNLKNFIHSIPGKNTFEARIFPGYLQAQPIIEAAQLMEEILFLAIKTGSE